MCGQIPEESQLLFRAPATASLECCCFIDDKEFLTGSDDGSVELWSIMRKKPTHIIRNAHPVFRNNLNSLENNVEGKMLYEEQFTTSCKVFLYVEFTSVLFSPFFSFCYYVVLFVVEMSINLIINFHHHHSIFFCSVCICVSYLLLCTSNAENGIHKPESVSSAQSWVSAIAARRGSDLAASGAANGSVRLWAIEPDSKGIRPLFSLRLVSYTSYSMIPLWMLL